MEPQLRRLQLPVSLQKGEFNPITGHLSGRLYSFAGIIYMDRDYQVCAAGDILTPEQAQILVYINISSSESVVSFWHAETLRQEACKVPDCAALLVAERQD